MSEPWSVKIPHVMGKLSLYSAIIEPVLWSPGVTTAEPTAAAEAHEPWSLCSTRETTTM